MGQIEAYLDRILNALGGGGSEDSPIYTVNLTWDEDGGYYHADHTNEEIFNAIVSRKSVYIIFSVPPEMGYDGWSFIAPVTLSGTRSYVTSFQASIWVADSYMLGTLYSDLNDPVGSNTKWWLDVDNFVSVDTNTISWFKSTFPVQYISFIALLPYISD